MAEQFAWELRFHPQRPQVDFVLDGIRHGFKLGFSPSQKLKSAKKNKPSVDQHASVIDAYLANEVSLGRVAGKWRLIVDLSSPSGASVNDGISADEFTLHYITVDQIIRSVSRLGKGALMAKFGVESAYRNVLVHPSDHHLLGI